MRKVTWSMGVSLDGYVVGPDGEFKWAEPGPDMFRFCIEELKKVEVPARPQALRDDGVLGDG